MILNLKSSILQILNLSSMVQLDQMHLLIEHRSLKNKCGHQINIPNRKPCSGLGSECMRCIGSEALAMAKQLSEFITFFRVKSGNCNKKRHAPALNQPMVKVIELQVNQIMRSIFMLTGVIYICLPILNWVIRLCWFFCFNGAIDQIRVYFTT